MKSNQSDKNLFYKLEKMFSFNKKDKTIFVPKELADQIVNDFESKEEPKVEISVSRRGRPRKVVETKEIKLVTPTEKKNIFDLTDISDIDPSLRLIEKDYSKFTYDEKIFELFDIAKSCGMDRLNFNQLAAGYYNVFCKNNKKETPLTRQQIADKIYMIQYRKKTNSKNEKITKVNGFSCTYQTSK